MQPSLIDQQRLAFGRAAELYERARPSYPAAALDALVGFGELAPGARVVDVGAGTGKATRMLAERGFDVTAVEPDPAMAALARANCAAYPSVEVKQVAFEDWRPEDKVSAVVSAQAWHWIDPDVRYARACEALACGGTLAAIWTFPSWATTALASRLAEAYRTSLPALAPAFPMHPASQPTELAGDWHAEINSTNELDAPRVLAYQWSAGYTAAEYCDLLGTHQDHILLDPADRARLLAAVACVIDDAGGTISMAFVTRVCLARRV